MIAERACGQRFHSMQRPLPLRWEVTGKSAHPHRPDKIFPQICRSPVRKQYLSGQTGGPVAGFEFLGLDSWVNEWKFPDRTKLDAPLPFNYFLSLQLGYAPVHSESGPIDIAWEPHACATTERDVPSSPEDSNLRGVSVCRAIYWCIVVDAIRHSATPPVPRL